MRRRRKAPEAAPATVTEAVYYTRVSSKEQEEEGFSLPDQIRNAREYAGKNRLTIVKEFVEVESARKPGRTLFDQMCAFIRQRKGPTVVICEKTDRLYRNLPDWVKMDDLMRERDVVLHLYKEGSILTKDSRSHEKFIHGIKVLMAKNYVDNLSEEVTKGMTEKARQGYYPGAAPPGYLNNPATRKLDVDEERAPIVRRLFELYANGNYSLADMRDVAEREGLTSNRRNVQPLGTSSIDRMLDNLIYVGRFLWKGVEYDGKHVPLISPELFMKVQAIKHGRNGGEYQERTFAFTGLITCGYCGCAITAEIKKGRYIYYHCTGGRRRCEGQSGAVREEEVDRQLAGIVAGLRMDDRVYASLREGLKASHEDEREYHARMLATLNGQLTKVSNRIRQLYIDKLDGQVDAGTYEELKARFEAEREDLRRQIAAHEKADKHYLEYGARLLARIIHRRRVQGVVPRMFAPVLGRENCVNRGCRADVVGG